MLKLQIKADIQNLAVFGKNLIKVSRLKKLEKDK